MTPTNLRRRWYALVAIAVLGIIIFLAVSHLALGVPMTNQTDSISNSGPCGAYQGFLIVENSTGINNSEYHGVPKNAWPVIRVQNNTYVKITVCNTSKMEYNGLVIYNSSNKTGGSSGNSCIAAPEHSCIISFFANQVGNFTMVNPVFTTADPYDLSGLLEVTQ